MRFTFLAVAAALSAASSLAADGSLRVPEEAAAATRRRLQKKGAATSTQIVRLGKDHWGDEAAECDALARAMVGAVGSVLPIIHGCTIEVPKNSVLALSAFPSVMDVEQDGIITVYQAADWRIDGIEEYLDGHPGTVYQVEDRVGVDSLVPWWNLDRLDQEAPPLDRQPFNKLDANGVRVYVIDTGIQGDHSEFAGMINEGCSVTTADAGGSPLEDIIGHGTHVASTACGLVYGVAANCELCAVKVFDSSGTGFRSWTLAGLQHALDSCLGDGKTCVFNMSIGGARSTQYNAAVDAAVDAGVTVVVSAGNHADDAINYSPASADKVITVGATDESEQASSFSNYGDAVDIYAPGTLVLAAHPTYGRALGSGTSMASPHVAGIAAFHLGSRAASNPVEVLEVILANQVAEGIDDRDFAGNPKNQGFARAVPLVCPLQRAQQG